jgi:hypothetical protein
MVKKPFYYILLIFCLVGTGVVMLLDKLATSVDPIERRDQEQERLMTDSYTGDLVLVDLQEKLSKGRDFYRQLIEGDRFSLLLDADDVNTLVEVRVAEISVEKLSVKKLSIESDITTIKGALAPNDGSVIMTIGDKFTHVFITANNAIFEFSGKDFQGIVARTVDMRLNNDITISRDQPVELYSPKLQEQKIVEERLN